MSIRRFIGRKAAATTAAAALTVPALFMLAAPANASSGAYGVVAVHTGGWGYREVVFGKGTTQQLANSPVWDLIPILMQATPYIPEAALVVESAYLIKYEAQQAVRSGQCFAAVRPTWVPWSFPGTESWGCR